VCVFFVFVCLFVCLFVCAYVQVHMGVCVNSLSFDIIWDCQLPLIIPTHCQNAEDYIIWSAPAMKVLKLLKSTCISMHIYCCGWYVIWEVRQCSSVLKLCEWVSRYIYKLYMKNFIENKNWNFRLCPTTDGTRWRSWLRHCATVERLRVRFPIDIILPAALWPWGWLSLKQKWVSGIFPEGEGSRCVGLTTLTPSCADCLEIW
jgi:hypothetical protein